jgi:DNA-binding SARP family transcriptional activator
MDFRILGPLEVLDKGEALDLGGNKQRALLACLLLHANEVVSTDRLIEALWEEGPPETAHKALQVYVSGLRKLLGKERLETKAPGYVLRVAEDELDLDRFQRLLDEGKAKEALALSRGQPLSDFAYSRFAQAEIARLEELRVSALEERIERDLAAGRHTELVGELEALVKANPLRERLRAQLMLVLYRSGRQVEALEAYQSARSALVDELGIEPGRQLRELHQAILNQDPLLELELHEAREEPESPLAATPPPEPEPLPREVRKVVTVLSAGVTSSTEAGERMDPEALRRVIGRGFAEIHGAVERHGGSVETTAADVITAVFGIPVVHEDDALRALRAAAEMRKQLAGLAEEMQSERSARMELRIGVSTGEVVTGGALLQPTGEPLIVAPRLAQQSRSGEIALDVATLRLARDAVVVESKEMSIRLIEVAPEPASHLIRFNAPMVGRTRERRRLRDAFEQAVGDRSCQLFTVLGLAGVGKSRLVEEFLADVAELALITRGRCLPYGEGITYWPVKEAVKEAVGLDDADSPEEAQAKLLAALGGEQGAESVAQRIGEVIGLAEAALGAEEGITAVRALFETLARARPLVVVFDDIHWGEPTFLDLIEHISDWTRDAPILLVCLARPELLDVRAGWAGGKLNATSILLESLSEAESTQLIESLAGAGLEESTRQRIVEAAEGNPLFVEEMLALVMEPQYGRADEVVVPPTIQALLAARLDRLSDGERTAIEAASVEGKVFHQGAVAELAPEALRPAAASNLEALLRKELVRPDRASFAGDRAFRFRHLLIRDAAYESIPKEARAELHERFAGWLEEKAGKHTPEWEEILGYHLEQAFRYRAELGPVDETGLELARRAAERLGAAGRRAFVRADAPAAVNLLSRAVSLLPPDDPARINLVPTVRVAQGLGGNLGWAVDVLDEAIAAGDDRLRAHALVQRGLLKLFTGPHAIGPDVTPEELIEIAEPAIQIFDELGDELGLARAWRLVGQAEYLARRAGSSVEAAERALVHARRAGDRFEEREIAEVGLGVGLALGPAPAPEAARRCEQLLEEAVGDPVLEANALGALAYFVAIQGRTAEARSSSPGAVASWRHSANGYGSILSTSRFLSCGRTI